MDVRRISAEILRHSINEIVDLLFRNLIPIQYLWNQQVIFIDKLIQLHAAVIVVVFDEVIVNINRFSN